MDENVVEICPQCLDWPVVIPGGVCRECALLDGGASLEALFMKTKEKLDNEDKEAK